MTELATCCAPYICPLTLLFCYSTVGVFATMLHVKSDGADCPDSLDSQVKNFQISNDLSFQWLRYCGEQGLGYAINFLVSNLWSFYLDQKHVPKTFEP
jgi:hypothetical protein